MGRTSLIDDLYEIEILSKRIASGDIRIVSASDRGSYHYDYVDRADARRRVMCSRNVAGFAWEHIQPR